MKVKLWPYFFKQALVNIMSNRGIHTVGLSTMIVSILIFGAFLLLFVNFNNWIQGWGHSLSVSVYLRDGINRATRDEVASFIKSLPRAEIKRFISKKGALRDLKNALGTHSGLLEGLSKNPLPASFEVVFKDIEGHKTDPQVIKKRARKGGRCARGPIQ